MFTSDHALKLEWVPDWIAIIGSGYIGLEFSDVYTALGSEVTFIEVCSLPCHGITAQHCACMCLQLSQRCGLDVSRRHCLMLLPNHLCVAV